MAIQSPVVDFPDMSASIAAAQARAMDLANSAWARPAQSAQAPSEADVQAMQMWGQGAAPTNQTPQVPAQGQGAVASGSGDEWAQHGLADNVPRSLISTESAGNWAAQNNVAGSGGNGHFGLLQFSRGRLQDAINAGAIGQMSPEQFMANKDAQIAASNWHFSDIDRRIQSNGLDRYIGQTIGGAPITQNGMRAMAHLGGFGGLSRYLSSNGSYNPADAFDTSLRDYAIRHQG